VGLGRLELPTSRLSGASVRGRNHGRMPESLDGLCDLPLSGFFHVVICRVQSTGQPTGPATGRRPLRHLTLPATTRSSTSRFLGVRKALAEADDCPDVAPAVTRRLTSPLRVTAFLAPAAYAQAISPMRLIAISSLNVHTNVHTLGTGWPSEDINEAQTACLKGRLLKLR
jgi:hypothetical protein